MAIYGISSLPESEEGMSFPEVTRMVLPACFEAFVVKSPVSVSSRRLWKGILPPDG